MAEPRVNLAVFISGGGSNLQALIEACRKPDYPARISLVLSNRPDAGGIARARAQDIPCAVVDHTHFKDREAFETAIETAMKDYPVDLICFAGFMRILGSDFVSRWEGRILNTHPSLLPRHGGEGLYGDRVHQSVLDSGDTESGATIHIVTAACDSGPVLLQKKVPVLPGDTPRSLAERVLEQEHLAYPEAVEILCARYKQTYPPPNPST